MTALLYQYLGPSEAHALKVLLEDAPGCEITRLKRDPGILAPVRWPVKLAGGIRSRRSMNWPKLLPYLDISNENIRYYASLVTYYSVFRLKQTRRGDHFLYLLCSCTIGIRSSRTIC